jgi:hypothetical protein
MLKVPVVWVKYSGAGNPDYNKVSGEPVFIIGEEGENVLRVTKSERVFIPIFEAASKEEMGPQGMILERMLVLAECCLLETGQVGTIYGVFRSSYQVKSEALMCVLEVGLLCTASKFNFCKASKFDPSDDKIEVGDCERLGLPVEIEIDTERGQPG